MIPPNDLTWRPVFFPRWAIEDVMAWRHWNKLHERIGNSQHVPNAELQLHFCQGNGKPYGWKMFHILYIVVLQHGTSVPFCQTSRLWRGAMLAITFPIQFCSVRQWWYWPHWPRSSCSRMQLCPHAWTTSTRSSRSPLTGLVFGHACGLPRKPRSMRLHPGTSDRGVKLGLPQAPLTAEGNQLWSGRGFRAWRTCHQTVVNDLEDMLLQRNQILWLRLERVLRMAFPDIASHKPTNVPNRIIIIMATSTSSFFLIQFITVLYVRLLIKMYKCHGGDHTK